MAATRGQGQTLLAEIKAKFEEAKAGEFQRQADMLRTMGKLQAFKADREDEQKAGEAKQQQAQAAQPTPTLEEIPINASSPQASPGVAFKDLANSIGNQANVSTRQALGTAPQANPGAQQIGTSFGDQSSNVAGASPTLPQQAFAPEQPRVDASRFQSPAFGSIRRGERVQDRLENLAGALLSPNPQDRQQAQQILSQLPPEVQQDVSLRAAAKREGADPKTQQSGVTAFNLAIAKGLGATRAAKAAQAVVAGNFDDLRDAYQGAPTLEADLTEVTIDNMESQIRARDGVIPEGGTFSGRTGMPSFTGGGTISDGKPLTAEQLRLNLKQSFGEKGDLTELGKSIRVPMQGELLDRNQLLIYGSRDPLGFGGDRISSAKISEVSRDEALGALATMRAHDEGISIPGRGVPTAADKKSASKLLDDIGLYGEDFTANEELEAALLLEVDNNIIPAWLEGQPAAGPDNIQDTEFPVKEKSKFKEFFKAVGAGGAALFRSLAQPTAQGLVTRALVPPPIGAPLAALQDAAARRRQGQAQGNPQAEVAARLGQEPSADFTVTAETVRSIMTSLGVPPKGNPSDAQMKPFLDARRAAGKKPLEDANLQELVLLLTDPNKVQAATAEIESRGGAVTT